MDSVDCLEIIEKVGMEYILFTIRFNDFNARLYYKNYRFGEIRTSDKGTFIHSHYWKPQDEFITKVSVESWEQSLLNFIKIVKERKVKEKIRGLNEEFR